MTNKEMLQAKVNEAMDIATIFLNRGDHKNYSECLKLIADMVADSIGYKAEA